MKKSTPAEQTIPSEVRLNLTQQLFLIKKWLKIFFPSHNSMALNHQGNDVGKQYHNVIFVWMTDKKYWLKS